MSAILETVGPRAGAAPLTYTLTETGSVDLQTMFARFDGAAASGAWRPVVTVRAQNGTILSRTGPEVALAAGDTADVTFAPFLRAVATSVLTLGVVGAAVRRPQTNPQSIPSGGGYTFATFTSDDFATAGMWSVSSPTRITCVQPGLYICMGSGGFVANVTGARHIAILQNGVTVIAGMQTAASPTSWVGSISGLTNAVAGDYIELGLFQTSGGNLDTGNCEMAMLGFGQV